MNGYDLSRAFWDFAFENTGKIKPIHTSIYFFAIEHCNRLGWKKNFGLPTSMVLEAISVKSYSVYKRAFDELVDYGFFDVIQYSKNQYSSNIIALKDNYKANSKALGKAMSKHTSKQCQSKVSIDKPITSKPINLEQENVYRSFAHLSLSESESQKLIADFGKTKLDDILDRIENFKGNTKYKSLFLTAKNWLKSDAEKSKPESVVIHKKSNGNLERLKEEQRLWDLQKQKDRNDKATTTGN